MFNKKIKLSIIILAVFSIAILSLGYSFAADSAKEEETLFVAQKAFDDGFYDLALSLSERFVKSYPNSNKVIEVNLMIAQCYFYQSKFYDALKKLEWLLNNPSASSVKDVVIYWIAEVNFKGNNFLKAAEYYKRIVTDFPKSNYVSYSYYSLGWCFFQDGQYKEALKYFDAVKDKTTDSIQIQDSTFKIIECLYNLKEYSQLKEKIKEYIKTYPKDSSKMPYIYFYLAEADYYLNNYQEAITEYSQVFLNSPDERIQVLSKISIGWAYLRLKQYPQAQDAFSGIKDNNLDRGTRDILLLGKATLFFQNNSFTEAKQIYDELIKNSSDPSVLAQAYLGKAESAYNLIDYKGSIALYQQGMSIIKPEFVSQEVINKMRYGLALAYLKDTNFNQAIEEFKKIIESSQEDSAKVNILYTLASAYQDSGYYGRAAEIYEKILKEYSGNPYSDYFSYQLGLVLLKDSKYDAAMAVLSNFRRDFPSSKLTDDAVYTLGLAYFQKKDYQPAIKILEESNSGFKDAKLKSDALYLLGSSFYNMDKFNRAIEVFKEILGIQGLDLDLIQKLEYEIADCYYQMGNEKEALNRFNILRSKYPDSKITPSVIWWLGEYYYGHNDFALSRRYFSSLIQDFPKSDLIPEVCYILGNISMQENKYQEAIENFNKTLKTPTIDLKVRAVMAIADVYLKQDNSDLAIKAYEDFIKDYPQTCNLICPKIAEFFYNKANYTESLKYYRKALDANLANQDIEVNFRVAEVLSLQGRSLEAISEYLKIASFYPEDKDILVKAYLRMAKIYEDNENLPEAVNIYKKIKTMNVPETAYAQERMDYIRGL